MSSAALRLLQVFRRRINSGENRNETGQGSEEPASEDHGVDLARGHSVVVEQRLVDDGVVPVQGDTGQVQD